ncbi:MAG: hypothetical protein Q7S21_07685 [archaeon]|nr:hypothetical protein [archaeon]
MPVKPLPMDLIRRLRRISHRLSLGKMKNIDHRQHEVSRAKTDVDNPGRRIRQLDVSRNFPEEQVVLKKVHGAPAKEIIEELKRIVREHNAKPHSPSYILLESIAYPISDEIVAMAKADFPSINETLNQYTERGRKMFEVLRKEMQKKSKKKIADKDVKHELQEAVYWLRYNTKYKLGEENVMLLGIDKGKFVFIPLVDLF